MACHHSPATALAAVGARRGPRQCQHPARNCLEAYLHLAAYSHTDPGVFDHIPRGTGPTTPVWLLPPPLLGVLPLKEHRFCFPYNSALVGGVKGGRLRYYSSHRYQSRGMLPAQPGATLILAQAGGSPLDESQRGRARCNRSLEVDLVLQL
jgi:hypothetical protein